MSESGPSGSDPSNRDIPSFIEPRPPLILNPFMRPRPQRAVNLMDLFEDSEFEEPELVQVYLRLKPCSKLNNLYEIRSDRTLITSLDTATVGHGRRTQHNVSKMYTFSHIFGPESDQRDLFHHVIKENLNQLPEGKSCTLMTYGASGSGKTFTLMGTVSAPGLVPRSLEYVFKLVDAAQRPELKPAEKGADRLTSLQQDYELQYVKNLTLVSAPLKDKYRRMSCSLSASDLSSSNFDLSKRTKYYVWVSFIEIYNEGIYDLLGNQKLRRNSSKLVIREDSSGNVYVKGATQVFVRSGQEAYNVMVAGKHNLQVAATGIHAHSSRSHSIFTITMMVETDDGVRTSCVRLCDLAGCERQARAQNTGTRMLESRAINSSLHVLERCLRTLRSRSALKNTTLIPYRESKLTRILGSGLSGTRGEAVSMVVTLNPAPEYANESRHVLQLAAVAKDIQISNISSDYASTLESTQDGSIEGGEQIMRLRADNERLRFELVQCQSFNEKLKEDMQRLDVEHAEALYRVYTETKEKGNKIYEREIEHLKQQIADYENRPENLQINTLMKEVSKYKIYYENEKKLRMSLEKELEELKELNAKSDAMPQEEIVNVTDSDESDSESLEPSFMKISQFKRRTTIAPTSINEQDEEEDEDYDSEDIDKENEDDDNCNDSTENNVTIRGHRDKFHDFESDILEVQDSKLTKKTYFFTKDLNHEEESSNGSPLKETKDTTKLSVDKNIIMASEKTDNLRKTETKLSRETYFVKVDSIDIKDTSDLKDLNKEDSYVTIDKKDRNSKDTFKDLTETNDYQINCKDDLIQNEALEKEKSLSRFTYCVSNNEEKAIEENCKSIKCNTSKDSLPAEDDSLEIAINRNNIVDKFVASNKESPQINNSLDLFEQLEKATKTSYPSLNRKDTDFFNVKTLKDNQNFFDKEDGKNEVLQSSSVFKCETRLLSSSNIQIKESIKKIIDRSPLTVKEHLSKDFEPPLINDFHGKNIKKMLSTSLAQEIKMYEKKQDSFDVFDVTNSPQRINEVEEEVRKSFQNIILSDNFEEKINEIISEPNTQDNTISEKKLKMDIESVKIVESDCKVQKEEIVESGCKAQKEEIIEPACTNQKEEIVEPDYKVQKAANKNVITNVSVEIVKVDSFDEKIISKNNSKVIEDSNNSRLQDNTVDQFENIYKDVTVPRATEFDLLLSQEIKDSTVEGSMDEPKCDDTKQSKTGKSRKKMDKTTSIDEVLLQSEAKCANKPMRTLRLRRHKKLSENDSDSKDNNVKNTEANKLKDIHNLQTEFSDVTMDQPAPLKEVKDIPSPELKISDENVPPRMGANTCPAKSVTRSRRKLFTPAAEPLEDEAQPDDSGGAVRVPRPSYHRPRARRKL